MSTDPYAPNPEPPGMTKAAKVLIGLGIGCAVVVLLCCGGFLGLAYYARDFFSHATSTVPADVRRITQEITPIEIPEPLKPEMSLDTKLPILGKSMSMVIYSDKPSESSLMLMTSELFENADRAKMRAQLDAQFQQQQGGRQQREELQIEKSENYQVVVNEQPADFTIVKGVGRRTHQTFWDAVGTFQGRKGPTVLLMRLNARVFPEKLVKGTIDSLQGDGGSEQTPAVDEHKPAETPTAPAQGRG